MNSPAFIHFLIPNYYNYIFFTNYTITPTCQNYACTSSHLRRDKCLIFQAPTAKCKVLFDQTTAESDAHSISLCAVCPHCAANLGANIGPITNYLACRLQHREATLFQLS